MNTSTLRTLKGMVIGTVSTSVLSSLSMLISATPANAATGNAWFCNQTPEFATVQISNGPSMIVEPGTCNYLQLATDSSPVRAGEQTYRFFASSASYRWHGSFSLSTYREARVDLYPAQNPVVY